MRFIQRIIIAAAAATVAILSAAPAMARYNGSTTDMAGPALFSYNGAWPITVSRSQRSNGTGCLTLSGRTSGLATLVFGGQKYQFGSFLVINGILVATIVEPLYGQNGALLFVAHASRGNLAPGLFENTEGGSNFDAGVLTFGLKNGC